MATDITIKRYNGSTWDELSPKTTITQVDGLQTALGNKQDKSNLVTSVSSSSTDTQYPSAKLFYDTTQSIMETAEGKTNSYVTYLIPITENSVAVYKLVFASQAWENPSTPISSSSTGVTFVTIEQTSNAIAIPSGVTYLYTLNYNGNLYYVRDSIKLSDLKIGDILNIVDLNYPDLWYGGTNAQDSKKYFYKMETSKVLLDNFVTLDTTQTITGAKIFNGFIQLNSGIKLAQAIGSTNYYATLQGNSTVTSNITVTLPTTSGELALKDDIAYPTSFSWTAGTTAGPTGTLSGTNMSAVSFGAIPSASGTNAGIVTTDTQTFTGVKTFNGFIQLNSGAKFQNGSNDSYATVQGNSSSTDNITLTLPASSGTLSLMQTFLDSNQPSGAHAGDIWFQTSA